MTRLTSTLAAAFLATLACAAPASARQEAKLLAPVSNTCVSSPFGPRILPNMPLAGSYHFGIDLAAPAGASVLAAGPGTVIRIQRKGPGGLEMLVQHDGFVAIYSHFGMIAPAFAEGKRTMEAGEKLGVVGRTGLSSGAHLFFEMILDGKPTDPSPYLGLAPCNGAPPPTVAAAPAAKPDDGGVAIGGRKYYQIFTQARQN